MERERGQSTVEWVGLLALVALLLIVLLATGVRVPGATLARVIASRVLCAAALADGCGDEPSLIAAYGVEVGGLVRDHMPTLAFEQGSRAIPVDWRRCRKSACGDGAEEGGPVLRSYTGLPVTAFVHVVDRRPQGWLYIQYWLYYADSATFRGVPVAEDLGYHRDDWESVQVRIGEDGRAEERASSHHGYGRGWEQETHLLLVSGGSHAGSVGDPGARFGPGDRFHPRFARGSRVALVPLEPIAAADSTRFAISPPWLKDVWRDPEAEGTS